MKTELKDIKDIPSNTKIIYGGVTGLLVNLDIDSNPCFLFKDEYPDNFFRSFTGWSLQTGKVSWPEHESFFTKMQDQGYTHGYWMAWEHRVDVIIEEELLNPHILL